MAEQSSSQSYPDYTVHLVLLAHRHKSRLFMAREPSVRMGLMPFVPQQSMIATLPQYDTSKPHKVEPSDPSVLNQRNLITNNQSTINTNNTHPQAPTRKQKLRCRQTDLTGTAWKDP